MNLQKAATALFLLATLTLTAACTHEATLTPATGTGSPGASATPAKDAMIVELRKYHVAISKKLQEAKTGVMAMASADRDALAEDVKAAEAKSAELAKKIADLRSVGKEDVEKSIKDTRNELANLDSTVTAISKKVKPVK